MQSAPLLAEPAVFHLPFDRDFDETVEALLVRVRPLGLAPTPLLTQHIARPQQASLAPTGLDPNRTLTPAELINAQLTTLLQSFDGDAAKNPDQLRRFVTNNLIRLSVEAKNESTQVKCLEMLGKHKDVGLFEERSTILVSNMDTDSIKAELRRLASSLRQHLTALPSQTQDITTLDATDLTTITPLETPHAEADRASAHH